MSSRTRTTEGNESPETRIAIIGCGFIGTIHSFAIHALVKGGLADAAVVATCDVDLEKANQTLAAHGEGLATENVEDALSGVDAAWICTPTAMHRDVVEKCVAAGVDIYCEKPLSTNLEGASAIAGLVANADLLSQVGLVLRYSPPYSSLAALCRGEVTEGGPDPSSLGPPMAAVLRDDQFFPVGGMYRSNWRADVDVAGGGTLIEHSIHDIDMLTWMLGPVVSVTARTQNHAGNRGIEDVAVVTLEHPDGALSSLQSVWHGVESRPSTRRLEVFFEKAHAVLEDEAVGPVRIERAEGNLEISLPARATELMSRLPVAEPIKPQILAYASSDLAFLQSLATRRRPEPGIDVALEAHRVVDAAYRSAAAGGTPESPG